MSRTWSAERNVVAKAYPGKKWMQKVLAMEDDQIHRIYVNLMNRKEREKARPKTLSECMAPTLQAVEELKKSVQI